MTYLDFWIFEIGHCIQKLREKNQNLFPITWNCNQLGASAPQKSSLQPPTDCNFMVLGVDFDFFLITFECNVRFQKFKSLNRSKFYPKSESLIKIYVSPLWSKVCVRPCLSSFFFFLSKSTYIVKSWRKNTKLLV